ncbi:preprotein translocase subunit SecY [Candidatus Babeliales bacterium]|nr:preprotein translocase subunit SecY [Candidatus Babeliales bacterium]
MIVLLRTFKNIFKIEDLRRKLFFTFMALAVFRFGKFVPLPGIDTVALQDLANTFFSGGFLQYMNMMSGGALSKGAIFALGIMPYISASIMMQVLTVALPSLEALAKEGEAGRRVINQYTRYLTVGLSMVQGFATVGLLEHGFGARLVLNPGWGFRITSVMILTVGALFVMWLGEQITQYGIGQGASVLIFANIVADLPSGILKMLNSIQLGEMDLLVALLIAGFTLALTACIVFLERGERRIPVQYARRVVGRRVFGGMNTYIPLKLNSAGVMPVILTSTMMVFVMWIVKAVSTRFGMVSFLADLFDPNSPFQIVLTVILIAFFSFVYTGIQYNPEELADNIRKAGGFIPGIRPGRRTAAFFNYVLMRLGTSGAAYLAILAVLPQLILRALSSPVYLSGLSLLIAVGVAMDTSSQIEATLIERKYEGFLGTGRLKGRRG